jgi:hypothetical protein
MRVLITGTGRCGTGWMARALTAAGAPCGHEAAFTARGHGDCDWVAEVSHVPGLADAAASYGYEVDQ